MTNRKVGIAMSGGVDSSVTAATVQKTGAEVHGFFMHLPLPTIEKHIERVKAVTEKLRIPLEIIDLQNFFSNKVIDYFIHTYRQGKTPNPCVICNKYVKFGRLLQSMLDRGMDMMATGHYARIIKDNKQNLLLQKGIDPKKDQSYFLCRLTSDQLKKIILPLGSLTKKEVYAQAADIGLDGIHGTESQDICFLTGESVASFFENHGHGNMPGDIVTTEGTVIGQHQGIWRYTIGQRRGLGLPDETPWYVYRLDAERNRVVVGKNEMLSTQRVVVRDMLWHIGEPTYPARVFVQIRGSHQPSAAVINRESANIWSITFNKPQRAVTPGQFAVLYDNNDILSGSSIISDESIQNGDQAP